jgi:hypothetical protein
MCISTIILIGIVVGFVVFGLAHVWGVWLGNRDADRMISKAWPSEERDACTCGLVMGHLLSCPAREFDKGVWADTI